MPFPSSTLYPSGDLYPGATGGRGTLRVREKPPLRLHLEVETPSGKLYRWASDEPDPANVPSDVRFSSTMPGGFESLDCKLARKPGTDYSDLERLSTIRALGPGGEGVWEGRLERTPRTSGSEFSISPSASGWQASLEDQKDVRLLGIDRDLSHWAGPSIARKLALNANYAVNDGSAAADTVTPKMRTGFTGPWSTTPGRPISEAWYDALGLSIGQLVYAWYRGVNPDPGDATFTNWTWAVFLASDLAAASTDASSNLRAAGPGLGSVTATAVRKFALLQLQYADVANTATTEYAIDWVPAVYGDHGMTDRGGGFYASDIVRHIIAPPLRVTDESVQDFTFLIEQFAFLEATTRAEIIKQACRFELPDWAVWEDQTFWLTRRGSTGRSWQARIAPAQLEETGPQADRLWSATVVSYQDVDGTTKTAGPPGSGADTESAVLQDSDPENPATKLGIKRTELLTMGTSTAAGATEVGRRFLEEQKLLDSSGRAQLVGYVTDDRGVMHPAWKVRAGDTVEFVDAASPSPRRIVKADYSHAARTCSVDLDSPPEALAALLERLGAAAQSRGFTS